MPDDVTKLIEQLRQAIIAKDTETMTRLANAYGEIYRALQVRINSLGEVVMNMDKITPGGLHRLIAYKELMREVDTQLTKYQNYAEVELTQAARRAIADGIADAGTMSTALGAGSFMRLNSAAVENMIAFLQKDSEMYKRLQYFAKDATDKVAQALINGVALGDNPIAIAKGLVKAFNDELGGKLVDMMRTARTAQIWAYREANRASYIANSDVVTGWIWFAELDGACMGCYAMHGTEHKLDEVLDDHYNGRCTMVPITILNPHPDWKKGEDWFKELSPAEQEKRMGPEKYAAWKEGKFTFDQLATHSDNEVYGSMTTETPLKDLTGGDIPIGTEPTNEPPPNDFNSMVTDVAGEFGLNKEDIIFSESAPENHPSAIAEYNPETGKITIFGNNASDLNREEMTSILAHENTHLMTDTLHKEMLQDEKNYKYDTEAYKLESSLTSIVDKESSTFSSYAESFWNGVNGKGGRDAMEETLAEAMRYMKSGRADEVPVDIQKGIIDLTYYYLGKKQ